MGFLKLEMGGGFKDADSVISGFCTTREVEERG